MRDAGDRLEREWDPDSPPDTFAAAVLAEAFGPDVNTLAAADVAAVGGLVEALLTTADESIGNAMATGFLESLLGQASKGAIAFRQIMPALGPESVRYCRSWDEFTGIKTDGLWDGDKPRQPEAMWEG